MSGPKIRTQSTFKSTLTIDDVAVNVRVVRMTNDQYDAFSEGYDRWTAPRGPEETPDERRARERASAQWLREALDTYLQIVPGEMEHDGREITKGGDLLDIYGGREDVIPVALVTVLLENRMSEAQKKTSRLLLASAFGSTNAPLPAAAGDAAASTVGNADANASTSAAAVTALPSDASSGTTDPTLETAAPASD
jgi:hypothetical protein